jgi:pimeloyl-ACP methyl ester carboxylesterase
VVLVHGFAGSSAIWFAIRRALCAAGRVLVTLNDPPWASSMDRLADRLIDAVEDLLAVTGAGKVRLVGHSLGGLVIALALTGRRLAGRVDLEVTLGTPFGGSPWAGMVPVCLIARVALPPDRSERCGRALILLRRLAAALTADWCDGSRSPRRLTRSSLLVAPDPPTGRPRAS